MFEEMPSGYHKIEGLDYLVRRINGADNPYYPEAPAIAWDGSGYIEFMEKAFNTFSIDYLHRLILHEKAHFLWAKIFDDDLKNEFTGIANNLISNEANIVQELKDIQGSKIEIGGYYRPNEAQVSSAMRPSKLFNAIINTI